MSIAKRQSHMQRSAVKLHEAAKAYRQLAIGCATVEAREVLLHEAEELEVEAANKLDLAERSVLLVPTFEWPTT